MALPYSLDWISDCVLRLRLGDEISPRTHARVRAIYEALRHADIDAVLNITPAYATICVTFDISRLHHETAEEQVMDIAAAAQMQPPAPARRVSIPVCYCGEHGPDLEEVARLHGLTPEAAIRLHGSAEYIVYFLGFSPGFAYLGGLPEKLATPRLPQPRRQVPAGSVGIAGLQTGIYPQSTPGGWRLIGRTPLALFDARREEPSLLRMGDVVRFAAISAEDFQRMLAEGR